LTDPMRSTITLRDGTALVTGAGSGIGRATALALAQEGAAVLCVDLDEGTAKSAAEACRDLGAEADAYQCDVADGAAMVRLAEQVHADHGPLTLLVNNAGVGMAGGFADMTLEDWAWIRAINLDGVVHGCHAFGPAMLAARRGHIVNMSSGLGYLLHSTEIAYCTTKAAVLAFSRALRADWRRQGVSVSAVCPGVINTPIAGTTRLVGDLDTERARARIQKTFGRGHGADVVAAAVLHAVRADKAVVPAGFEARVGWHLTKLLPQVVQERLGRPAPAWLTRDR
jgi:2-hydroxycyclohexanecarboxyl-CoA dehydrogenase